MKSKLWKLIHKWRDATTTESAWIARDQIDIELDKIEAAMTQEPVYGRYNAKIGMGESVKGYTYCHTPAHMDAWSAQQGATWEPLYLAAGAQERKPLSEFERMQIIGNEFPLPLVKPLIIQKIDSVCIAIEAAHGIKEQLK